MIHFKYVRWKNFLSTGNAFTEVQLDKSKSTLIVGSNGAGKSTILDAISFALYNKPFRKINKPQMINSINNKNCVVEIEFAVGGSDYKVVRGMKPNIFSVYRDGELINQNASIRDYQDYLEKNILKLNHRSFTQVVVLGSATYVPFMQLSAYQRREVIEDLLDIQIFSIMNNLLREKVNTNRERQTEVKYEIELTQERIALQEQLLRERTADLAAQVRDRNEKVQKIEHDIAALTEREESLIAMVNELSSDAKHQEVSAKLSKLQNLRERLFEKLDKLKKEINFYHDNENCPTCKQGIDHSFREGVVQEKQEEQQKVEETIPQVAEYYANLQKELEEANKVQREIQSKNNEITGIRSSITTLRASLKELQREIQKLKQKNDAFDNGKLEELKIDYEAQQKLREELANEGVVLSAASALLKDGGIKSKIIKQYVPIMNKLINKYLATMDFFVHFELDENFNEVIKSRFRDEFSYQSFSEGEKMRINLGILFTWRAIAKMRNSASTNLLIMDEVLDSSLDNAGTEEFLKIIEELTKDTNLFIISHKGDQLFDKFHSVIRFEKKGNFSSMVNS